MILTGKMYKYFYNKNYYYLYLEIDRNWFINNILPNLPQCYKCFKCNTEKDCLFLYNCKHKIFCCVPSYQEEFKLIEKLDNIK
ncbi:hypothetical protein M0R19_03735 [Candidatus Pacearchaeota archaeon]|jgi:hypothetical protein|nr:hypothetical protein [Candidatus Pacearchaeota archaeon]